MKNKKDKNAFYITTTLPYVNATPHIGFAMEIVLADIIARWKKLSGCEVFFNTGTDEHGEKVYRAALYAKYDPKLYADEYSEKFRSLKEILGLSEDLHFIRTTDESHRKAAQDFWKRCRDNGDIYKANYKIKYCLGCELEKTDSELIDGKCSLHPDRELEIREEENYFFRFSNYEKQLLDLYESSPDFVIPNFRLNEMRSLISRGLSDFSISRLRAKMPWGVAVPDDPDHIMYVWFDALVNYISTLGWGSDDGSKFEKFWVKGMTVQIAGKDQVRQQAAMWQAMLLSAGLPPTDHILIHGFINFGGQKMSKSLGNVISPEKVVEEFGTEALRYFITREFNQFEDTDITESRLKEAYNANLANGLGNLVSRIMKMAETHLDKSPELPEKSIPRDYIEALDKFEIQKAVNIIWDKVRELDAKIQKTEPFKLVKTDSEEGKSLISEIVVSLYTIGLMLNPVMPETSSAIKDAVKKNVSPLTLFPRIE